MSSSRGAHRALAAATLGFFVITLDALVISVVLPEIRDELGGDLRGLQWIMDGYTLPFAALLLLSGALTDRLGARRVFGWGFTAFVVSSLGCGLAGTAWALVLARVAQGMGAAMMMPASLALIGQSHPTPSERARAISLWAAGGAVASATGPLVGGALSLLSWRLIFLINLPVGLLALWLLRKVPASSRHATPFDVWSQLSAVAALTGVTYALIEAGEPRALPLALASGVAVLGAMMFHLRERKAPHPLIPSSLFQNRESSTTIQIGFTFMAAFFGMIFLMSLLLHDARGLDSFQTGLAFAPVTAASIVMPFLGARLGARFGAWLPITLGQLSMAVGLFGLAIFARSASTPVLVGWMTPVGCGGGLAMPSATALLLASVPKERTGIASGVLNTSRQVGGALAIAAFGALVAAHGTVLGTRLSLAIAGTLVTFTLLAGLWLHDPLRERRFRDRRARGRGLT